MLLQENGAATKVQESKIFHLPKDLFYIGFGFPLHDDVKEEDEKEEGEEEDEKEEEDEEEVEDDDEFTPRTILLTFVHLLSPRLGLCCASISIGV